jgi:anti-sigma factor RsiW
MSQDQPLNEEERDDLVAYLDGELDRHAATKLEAKIQRNPSVRAEADQLRKTWELVDHLPRPEPSTNFTHRTLELVAAHKLRVKPTRWKVGWRMTSLGVAWAAAIVVASAVGFAASKWLPHNERQPVLDPTQLAEQEALIRDLPVIENKRLYDHADDLAFVEDLADANDPDLFGDEGIGS